MKAWEKIENLINKLLTMLKALIVSTISKLTPSKVKATIETSQKKIDDTTDFLQKEVKEKSQLALSKTLKAKDVTLKNINDKKEDATKLVANAKTYNWKSLTPKKITAMTLALFMPAINKIKAWWMNLEPTSILSFVVIGAAASLTGITVYTQSKDIMDKSSEGREPAQVVEEMKAGKLTGNKSSQERRSLRLANVKMPVYILSRKHLNTLLIDFTIVSSNVYIREFFYDIENETLIRDRLSVRVQQFVSDFSLQEEGKDIIKKKIKKELNLLIKDLKIKGEVEEVYIHHLLAN